MLIAAMLFLILACAVAVSVYIHIKYPKSGSLEDQQAQTIQTVGQLGGTSTEQPTKLGCLDDPDKQAEMTHTLGRGDLKTVLVLINATGIDPRVCRDSSGKSALMAAVRANNMVIVKYLVERWNWKVTCHDEWSEVHEACYLGYMDIVEYFVKHVTSCSSTLTKAAAIGGQVEVLKYLIKLGYEFGCITNGPWSVVHQASYEGQTNIIEFYAEVVGKDICTKCVDQSGNTLLHAAALKMATGGQIEVVRYLTVEQHCDVTVRNKEGQLPLDTARKAHNKLMIKYLSEN